jgi:hypothetical protein
MHFFARNTGFYSRVIRLDCQVNDPVQGETIRRVRDAQHPAS